MEKTQNVGTKSAFTPSLYLLKRVLMRYLTWTKLNPWHDIIGTHEKIYIIETQFLFLRLQQISLKQGKGLIEGGQTKQWFIGSISKP